MHKISKPTKSFIILFLLAIFGTCFSVLLWLNSTNKTSNTTVYQNSENENLVDRLHNQDNTISADNNIINIDTSSWKTYSSAELNFKYPADWKILPTTKKDGYTILQIDPGAKFYNIKIYISPNDFYVMSGLPSTVEKINEEDAINVSNLLYGIKHKDTYYTFDIGLSLSLKPLFNALVHSVEFK